MGGYQYAGFSKETLLDFIVKGNKHTTESAIKRDRHFGYLLSYLNDSEINAKFMISEDGYVSVDYLLDYAHYYSRNHENYPSKCTRIHFFSTEANDDKDFKEKIEKSLLVGSSDENLWGSEYLGFIVIRPIPIFFLGYSILRLYQPGTSNPNIVRKFWGTKTYTVHLFGKEIKIESLGFISQDNNVAACATIAVWCMLQRAVEDYYINLKSPFQITQDAGLMLKDGNRIMPSSGLDPISICSAITKSNLKTLIFESKDSKIDTKPKPKLFGHFSFGRKPDTDGLYYLQIIKEHLYAYSKIGLPVILGLKVPENKVYYNHAIAVAGTAIDESKDFELIDYTKDSSSFGTVQFYHRAQRINKLYCHDDQFGPFAAVSIDDKKGMLKTPWSQGVDSIYLSKPNLIIVSVFEKIRIPYLDIRIATSDLNKFLGFLFRETGFKGSDLEWDIRLYMGHDFKKKVLQESKSAQNATSELLKILSFPLPKYVWISELISKTDGSLGYFIFDATGLRGTPLLMGWFTFIPEFSAMLRDFYLLYKDEPHLSDSHILLDKFDEKVMLFEKNL